MFKTAASRFTLRGIVQATIAGLAVAATIWVDNPYIKVASGAFGALALYFGIGAVSPQVEPYVGVKKADPDMRQIPNRLP